MKIDNPIIYECPHCSKKLEGLNIVSGNNFGARYFSDGNAFMPMMPKMPRITRCPGCQNFFWLEKQINRELDELLESAFSDENPEHNDMGSPWLLNENNLEEWLTSHRSTDKEQEQKANIKKDKHKKQLPETEYGQLPSIKHLNAEELQLAIMQNTHENDVERELYLRKRHWFAINDRKKNGEEMFVTQEERLFWEENLYSILEFLNPEDMSDRCFKAEIYRNLGQFDRCLDILKQIEGKAYQICKKTITAECNRQNRWVVELKG